jgi:hypothetical protein
MKGFHQSKLKSFLSKIWICTSQTEIVIIIESAKDVKSFFLKQPNIRGELWIVANYSNFIQVYGLSHPGAW